MIKRIRKWMAIKASRIVSKMEKGCPWKMDIRLAFERGEYERAGKDLLFYYGPCGLDHLPDVNHYLAEYYHAIGDEKKHCYHLEKALSLYDFANDPYGAGRAHCYLLLARVRWNEGNFQGVIKYCNKALEISVHDPVNIILHHMLSVAYEEVGEYVKAKEHEAKYRELCKNNEAYIYKMEGQDFYTIHEDARKVRVPYSRWKNLTDKEKRKALLKAGRYFG